MFKLFQGRRAESMESLLSLSDVELGMEEHAGDTEDVDYHKRKIKRRVSVVHVRKMDYCTLYLEITMKFCVRIQV